MVPPSGLRRVVILACMWVCVGHIARQLYIATHDIYRTDTFMYAGRTACQHPRVAFADRKQVRVNGVLHHAPTRAEILCGSDAAFNLTGELAVELFMRTPISHER